ncbi:hypothetical protein C3O68_05727 [Pseudomonas aeruginosa]|nr:hypothetical protein C3O68_05727 [Pseudomonas aeruginosa]
MEGCAQCIVSSGHLAPGCLEARHIDVAVDDIAILHEIDARVRLHQGVQQQTFLHRSQWIDVFDFPIRQGQRIELRLIQSGKREVGRRHSSGSRIATMLDQSVQIGREGVDELLHRLVGEHIGAEGPSQAELPLIDLPFDREPVCKRRTFVLCTAGTLRGWHPQGLVGELMVELAEIIEGYAWLRRPSQNFTASRVCQVAQQAIADPSVGNRTQLFLDALDRGARLDSRMQVHRIETGEPTNGAAQIQLAPQFLAPVSLQLQKQTFVTAPVTNHTCQGGQQQVDDLGAIGCRGLLEQTSGSLGIEGQGQLAGVAVLQRSMRILARQVGWRAIQVCLPERQFVMPLPCHFTQMCAPGLVGVCAQYRRRVRALVELLQVFQQNPPGHTVHDQVMNHQQEPLLTFGKLDQKSAQQRTGAQIEATLGFLAQRGEFFDRSDLAPPERAFNLTGIFLPPAPFFLMEAQAQGIMLANQSEQGLLQTFAIDRLASLQKQRLVPVPAIRDVQPEEPVLDWCQGHLPAYRCLNYRAVARHRHLRQPTDGLVLEQVSRTQPETGLTGPTDHLDRDDRVSTEGEEIIVKPYPLDAQQRFPDFRQTAFRRTARHAVNHLPKGRIRPGQRLAIQFTVGAQRHALQSDPLHRHHVFRQTLSQMGREHPAPFVGLGSQRHIADQLLAIHHQHSRLANSVVLQQARLDLTQLDAQSTQLDLMIDTSGIFDDAIRSITCEVSRTIHALARGERIGEEAFGAQRGAKMVAPRKAGASQVQLTQRPHWHRLQGIVENVATQIGDRTSDRNRIAPLLPTVPMGHVDSRLGRAVEVVQAYSRQFGEHPLLRIHRQSLATTDNPLEAGASGNPRRLQEGLQHGRHKVQRTDALPTDQIHQP